VTSKLDQIRALRERNYEEGQAARKPVAKQAKLTKAKNAAKAHVTDKRVTDNSVTDKICAVCNEPFAAKRADATICSAACRMRKRRAEGKQSA
jgi:hypothetical protein